MKRSAMRFLSFALLSSIIASCATQSSGGKPATTPTVPGGESAALPASKADRPKIAVLDALVSEKVDASVVGLVTESVMEPMVTSERFTVLDRKYVNQALKEHEFQMSDIVSTAEITKLGAYLGARYIVVINIDYSLGVYGIVGKMIDVETGVIVSQKSEKREGKQTELFAMAQSLGEKLAGMNGSAQGAAQPAAQPAARAATAAPAEQKAAKAPDSAAVSPGSGASLSGIIRYGAVSLSTQTQVEPTVELKVYAQSQWSDIVDASFEYDASTGRYSVTGLPSTKDTILLRLIFRNGTERITLPGNYWLEEYLHVDQIAHPLANDLQAFVIVHLTEPFDGAILQDDITRRASYSSPVTFRWDAVPTAARYVYKVDEAQEGTGSSVSTPFPLKSTKETSITLNLKPSAPNRFYRIDLQAQDSAGTALGKLYTTASNGYAWFYSFVVW